MKDSYTLKSLAVLLENNKISSKDIAVNEIAEMMARSSSTFELPPMDMIG